MKRTIAILSAGVFFAASVLSSLLAGVYLKSTNPDNIDISQGLAYLGHSIIVAVGVMVIFLLVCFIFSFLTYKQEGYNGARLPLALLAANLLLVVLIAVTNARINQIQDKYLIDHGRPTLQQYFEAIKQQKK